MEMVRKKYITLEQIIHGRFSVSPEVYNEHVLANCAVSPSFMFSSAFFMLFLLF